mmetsp:Transcript_79648/g.200377  ORF Transcript_79648/g.200377 Transcript_79648/m.200377 type:complete len:203 (+) Transcript_79648:619-1227(+)
MVHDLVEVPPRVGATDAGRLQVLASDTAVVECHTMEAAIFQVPHGVLDEACAAIVVEPWQHENNSVLGRIFGWFAPVQRDGAPILQRQNLLLARRHCSGEHGPETAPEGGYVAAELEDRVGPIVAQQQLDLLQQVFVLKLPFLHWSMDQGRCFQLLFQVALQQCEGCHQRRTGPGCSPCCHLLPWHRPWARNSAAEPACPGW